MKRKWDPSQWKKSTKLLLGLATAWPYVYLIFFIAGVSVLTLFLSPHRSAEHCGYLEVTQLEKKIQNGEIKELVVKPTEILARNRSETCTYTVFVPQESLRQEILRIAREVDANGVPRVSSVSEEAGPNVSPYAVAGFAAVFVVHMLTIILVLGLIAIYVVLAVKNETLDQTKKIIWLVALALFTLISMPVYWYLYVWRKPPAANGPNESKATT